PQDDRGLSVGFGLPDIRDAFGLDDMIRIFAEPAVPLRNVADRIREVFPDAAGAIRGRQTGLLHLAEKLAAPFRDDKPVHDDRAFIDAGCAVLHDILRFICPERRGPRAAWRSRSGGFGWGDGSAGKLADNLEPAFRGARGCALCFAARDRVGSDAPRCADEL